MNIGARCAACGARFEGRGSDLREPMQRHLDAHAPDDFRERDEDGNAVLIAFDPVVISDHSEDGASA